MASLEVRLVHQKVKLAGKDVDFCSLIVDGLGEVVNLTVLVPNFLGFLAVGHRKDGTST